MTMRERQREQEREIERDPKVTHLIHPIDSFLIGYFPYGLTNKETPLCGHGVDKQIHFSGASLSVSAREKVFNFARQELGEYILWRVGGTGTGGSEYQLAYMHSTHAYLYLYLFLPPVFKCLSLSLLPLPDHLANLTASTTYTPCIVYSPW